MGPLVPPGGLAAVVKMQLMLAWADRLTWVAHPVACQLIGLNLSDLVRLTATVTSNLSAAWHVKTMVTWQEES